MRYLTTGFLTICIVCMSWVLPTQAQPSVRTANPPAIEIRLGAKEPPPAGVAKEMGYGIGGTGGKGAGTTSKPFWVVLPRQLDQGGIFVACGYRRSMPEASLQTPSGKSLSLSITPLSTIIGILGSYLGMVQFPSSGCYGYIVEFVVGTELGMYTLTLKHPDGTLSHQWGVDYPYCSHQVILTEKSQNAQIFLMGLPPKEQVTILFFYLKTVSAPHEFLAKRDIVPDKEGALLLNLILERSAPFRFGDRDRLPFINPESEGRPLLFLILNSRNELLFAPFGGLLPYEAYEYSGAVKPRGVNDQDLDKYLWKPCDGNYGKRAKVLSSSTNIAVYSQPSIEKPVIATLSNDTEVKITDRKVGLVNGRVEVWQQVVLANNLVGWAYGPHFISLDGGRSYQNRFIWPSDIQPR